VPGVNASWFPDFIRQYHDENVGVAVQTPGGLMVPVVRDADLLGLAEIGATVKELAGRVRPPRPACARRPGRAALAAAPRLLALADRRARAAGLAGRGVCRLCFKTLSSVPQKK